MKGLRRASLGFLALSLSIGACGGGHSSRAGGEARFLLLAHQPLAGSLRTESDIHLLDLGHQACAAFDGHANSDQVVTQLGGPEALPGSATYNDMSFVVVDAASELCPQHKGEVSGAIPG
jgi:hypothetical protein